MTRVIPYGNDMVGVVHVLQNAYKEKAKEFIKIENSSRQNDSKNWGSADALIKYGDSGEYHSNTFCSMNLKNSFFILFFPENLVEITHYTFYSRNVAKQDMLQTWVVEGSNNKVRWNYIDHVVNDTDIIELGITKTYKVKRPGKYRYFRFLQNGTNSIGRDYMSLCKFDIFGSIFGKREIRCTPNYKQNHLPKTPFIMLFSCYC